MKRYKQFASLVAAAAVLIGCKEAVLSGVSDADSVQIILKLAERGIPAERQKSGEGFSIKVDSNKAEEALRLISSKGLLRLPEERERLDLSPMAAHEEQVFALERAQSRQIEKTLLRLRGVVDARVHLNRVWQETIFGAQSGASSQASASALLITAPGVTLNTSDVSSLISGSSGIPAERVVVIAAEAEQQTVSTATSEIRAPNHPSRIGLASIGVGISALSLFLLRRLFRRGFGQMREIGEMR